MVRFGWTQFCVWSTGRVCDVLSALNDRHHRRHRRYSASRLHSSRSASLHRRHSSVYYLRHRTATNHKLTASECLSVSVSSCVCTPQRFSIISGDCAALVGCRLRHDINVQHCLNCQRRGRPAGVPCRASMFAQCDDARQTIGVARNSDSKSHTDLHFLSGLRLGLLHSTALQNKRDFIISCTTSGILLPFWGNFYRNVNWFLVTIFENMQHRRRQIWQKLIFRVLGVL